MKHSSYLNNGNRLKTERYVINKGVNRPIEFKGLKAQYIYYLAGGLAFLLVLFSLLYIMGLPVYLVLVLILFMGGGLFYGVNRLNQLYGEYGLMKRAAHKRLPTGLRVRSLRIIRGL